MHMHAQLRIKDDELRVLTSQVGLKHSNPVWLLLPGMPISCNYHEAAHTSQCTDVHSA